MNPFIYPTIPALDLAGKTLIVPVVSAANVSQLATDLLIASFSLDCLAILNAEFFVPVIGEERTGAKGITTPLELYGKAGTDLLVIQQRSPVLKSRKSDFVAALLQFIQVSNVGCVLFLSGVDLTNRMDSQMFTPTYQVRPQKGVELDGTALGTLNSLPIPAYTSPTPQHPQGDDEDIPFIPGGGLTRRILSSLPDAWSIPTASLLQFVLEGDNRADARLFAMVAAKVIGLGSSIEWRSPSSWKQGLFGAPHDQTLYG